MILSRTRTARSVARAALPAALVLILPGCVPGSEEDTRDASGRQVGDAASNISLPLSRPTVIAPPSDDGTVPPVVDTTTTVPPPAGETVLDRLQTRFRSEDDADFWLCFVFSPETTVIAYNFVGNIGASASQRVDSEDEPTVRTYVATATDVDAVMLDFNETSEGEELSQIVVTGSGAGATLQTFSSTWGALSCSTLNSAATL